MYILLCGYPPFSGNCEEDCGWNRGENCSNCQKLLFESIQEGMFSKPKSTYFLWQKHWILPLNISKNNNINTIFVLNLLAGRFSFPEREWSDVSEEAKDLIRGLLVKVAPKRLSAEAVLHHKWIKMADENYKFDKVVMQKRRRALKTSGIIRRWVNVL